MNKHKRFESHGHASNGYSIGFDINIYGTLLASASSNGSIFIYNLQTSKLFSRLDAFNKLMLKQPCMDAKFNLFQNGKSLLAVSSWEGLIKIYEI